MSVVTKGPKIIKSIRKKLFPLEIKEGPGAKDKFKKLDPKSPYYNVDELGSPPLHRGGGIAQRGLGRAFMKGGRVR